MASSGARARSIPETEMLEAGASARGYLLHDIHELDLDPADSRFVERSFKAF